MAKENRRKKKRIENGDSTENLRKIYGKSTETE